MYLKTKYNLWKLKRDLSPSVIFKVKLKKDLNQVWAKKYGQVAWYHSGLMYRTGAFATALLVLMGGGSVFAYSNPGVVEGSLLYPVKIAIEKVEEVTRFTPEAKAKFYLKKIIRREAERERLKEPKNKIEEKTGAQVIENKIKKTEKSIEEAEDQLEKFNENIQKFELNNPQLKEDIKIRIENRLEKRRQKLEKVSEQIKIRDERAKGSVEKIREIRPKKVEGN